jgi:DNA mismatch repair protein MutL
MAHIHVLLPEVVNQIAAGEVIERPASVVKELIENALDAGALEVRVDVEEGGRRLVRVSDNGCGMAAEDLALAFAAHATSKLRAAEDLFRVTTYGFRGEALASIGAVARARIVSRSGEGEGAEIVVEEGKTEGARPAAAAPGTVVEVRDLFHGVPARRKFLRSVEVETEHVVEAVSRFAIARPEVRFDLFVDGARRQALPPADRRARIGGFFGEELAGALREVREGPFEALAAPPQYSRVNTRGIHFYLNGRFIRDRVLLRAVGEAYREMIPHGRSPVAFVFLSLPPGDVDVNVHPTKIEVRFRNAWRLHDRLAEALRRELLGGDLDVRLAPERLADPGGNVRAVVDFFGGVRPEPAGAGPEARPLVVSGRRVFQIHDRYLVEEVEDGIRILDQHALHERVMLEELRREYRSARVASQKLLLPAVVEVPRERKAVLEDHRELLESFGVEFGDFGPDAVAVRAVPALVGDADPARLLADFAELAAERGADGSLFERALEFLACRAAVKFGRRLADEEISRLLSDAEGLDFSQACAHGRPTAVKLSLADLERFFHR